MRLWRAKNPCGHDRTVSSIDALSATTIGGCSGSMQRRRSVPDSYSARAHVRTTMVMQNAASSNTEGVLRTMDMYLLRTGEGGAGQTASQMSMQSTRLSTNGAEAFASFSAVNYYWDTPFLAARSCAIW